MLRLCGQRDAPRGLLSHARREPLRDVMAPGMKRASASVPNMESLLQKRKDGGAGSSTAEQQRNISRIGDWVAPPISPGSSSKGAPSLSPNFGSYHRLGDGPLPVLHHTPSPQLITKRGRCTGAFMKMHGYAKSCMPILTWLPRYSFQDNFFYDFCGGSTLAMICLVQTLAHASIATTEVIQGPYCAFVPPMIYALLGTSRHTSVSSGAIVAIIVADQLHDWPDIRDRTELASLLAMISGFTLVLMGVCRAAFAVRFLSQSLISGFVTGGAVLIMQGQLKNLMGLEHVRHSIGFFMTGHGILAHLDDVNVVGLCLGVASILFLNFMVYLKKEVVPALKKRGVAAWQLRFIKVSSEMKEILLVAFGLAFAYSTATQSHHGEVETLLPVVGHIAPGLPKARLPWDGEAARDLLGLSSDGDVLGPTRRHQFFFGGALVALSAFLTTYATSKKQATNHGYRLDASQEILALGVAGVAGSCFGSFTPSGSLSRTALASELGVRSQLQGVVMACVVGISLKLATPVLFFLPKASLAAIVMRSAWSLMDLQTAKDLWASWQPHRDGGQRRDLVVWCVAFTLTIYLGALYGIACAVLVALGLIVYDAATPSVVILGCVEQLGSLWRNVDVWTQGRTFPGLMVVEFRGPLSFASAEWFEDEVESKRIATGEATGVPVKVIVLAFGSVHDLDPTALSMLGEMLKNWKKYGVSCIIADAKSRVRLLVEKHFAQGDNPLLDQPAFLITIGDAVDMALRQLGARGQLEPSSPSLPCAKCGGVSRRFGRRRAYDV